MNEKQFEKYRIKIREVFGNKYLSEEDIKKKLDEIIEEIYILGCEEEKEFGENETESEGIPWGDLDQELRL